MGVPHPSNTPRFSSKQILYYKYAILAKRIYSLTFCKGKWRRYLNRDVYDI